MDRELHHPVSDHIVHYRGRSRGVQDLRVVTTVGRFMEMAPPEAVARQCIPDCASEN